ncbi:DNA/RNA non-specific endonuclease [Fructobacillus sp. M1-13]|uniref:DNA-entry nuclease n=1 Tax=Fructobacillus papyriferae TaxID=2713171 RepID=A0ABS5QPY7_9LACO|nr:DNA/RNA non-specific endonuclease [Fructobacillus papyriferae]MBS9335243.1 DNA-entry nuclease [Fructobacillus papyriferae]MCD2159088.1 DNA/RNA non-specific endonuclease [Fructobacillus papyriferae]
MAKQQPNQKRFTQTVTIIIALVAVFAFQYDQKGQTKQAPKEEKQQSQVFHSTKDAKNVQTAASDQDLLTISWDGTLDGDIVHLNDNRATFTAEELRQTFQADGSKLNPVNGLSLSPLDTLGRSGQANFVVSKKAMDQVTKRPSQIPKSVRPSGWNQGDRFNGTAWVGGYHQNPKVSLGGTKQALYNKSHIVGYQFFGMPTMVTENMTTGTRVENAYPGQLVPEDDIRYAIKQNPNITIRGQVTPIYSGNELLPRGVHYMAKSVEDNGQTLNLNYWIFNVQPGVSINYMTGAATIQ